MKKILIPLIILLCISSVSSQEFKSEKLKANEWDTNDVVTLKAENCTDEIKIGALSKKIDRSHKRVKQISINADSYQLIESCGSIDILNTKGESLLKTNRDRSEITLPGHRQVTRRKLKSGTFEYLDSNNRVLVSGQYKEGRIQLKNHAGKPNKVLMALCLEELVQHAYDRYLHTVMISSFLAQTD